MLGLPAVFSTSASLLLVALGGCGVLGGRFSDERQVCDAYLDCAADVTPEAVGTLVAQYGSDSDCWDNRDQAELCAATCQIGAASMIAAADDPTSCELAAAGPGSGEWECASSLTEEQFAERFLGRLCVEWGACASPDISDAFCDPEEPTGNTSSAAECSFDRERGCACLDATYTCNREFPGFEFVDTPQACLDTYDCQR